MVKDKVAEVEWKYLDVNEHLQQSHTCLSTKITNLK